MARFSGYRAPPGIAPLPMVKRGSPVSGARPLGPIPMMRVAGRRPLDPGVPAAIR